MMIMGGATDAQMILEFLKAEHSGHPLVVHANLGDEGENREREEMLDRRGYRERTHLFHLFPRDVTWRWAQLSIDEFEPLRHLNCEPWRSLTGKTLRVFDAAARIGAGVFDPNVRADVSKMRAIAETLRGGNDLSAALILAEAGDGRIIIAEGNHRAIGYVLAVVDRPILALCGTSASMAQWANHRWN
jgi:hypothetical protein